MSASSAHRLGFMALSSVIAMGLIVLVTLALGTTPGTSALSEAATILDTESVIRPHISTSAQTWRAPTAPWVKIVDYPVFAYQGQPVTVTVAWGDIPTDGRYKLIVQLENKLLKPDVYYAVVDILDYSMTGTRSITLVVPITVSGVSNAFPRYGARFVTAFISTIDEWDDILAADFSAPHDVSIETSPPAGWTSGQFRVAGPDAGGFLDPTGSLFYARGMVYAYENTTGACDQGRATTVISDLIHIKALGFNAIRLYTPSGANRLDGLTQSDCLPEVLSWADLNRIALYVRVNYWDQVEYPDYRDAQYHQQAKDSLQDFLKLARPHPSFLAVDLDQRWLFGVKWEGWYRYDRPCLMTETLAGLPPWLADRYGGAIAALNTVWNKQYANFSDILSDPEIVSKVMPFDPDCNAEQQIMPLDRHPWRLDLVDYTLWVMDDFSSDVISYARSIAPDHLYAFASDQPEVIPFPISTRASSGTDFGGPVHYSLAADYYRDWIARAKLTYGTLWQRDLYGLPMFIDESGWRTTALPDPVPVPGHGWSPTETNKAQFYLQQATLLSAYPWIPGWAYFKLYDKPEEGDWGFLNDDGTHRPIADLARCINSAILTNNTGRRAPRWWVYYPAYALAAPYPAYEDYKTLIEVLEHDFFNAYDEQVAETWGKVSWPLTDCASITNTRLFADLIDTFNERWQSIAFTGTLPANDLPILLAGRELESLSSPDRAALAQKRTVTFGPIGITDERLRTTAPWYAQAVSLTVPAPTTTSAECPAAANPTVNILSYPKTAYAGRSVDVALEWCNLPPNSDQNYDLVVQLEDWRVGADALYLQWFHAFSQTGMLTVTLDVDIEHALTYTQPITDARYVAAFVSKSCGWCGVLAMDATPANVTIQPRRWITITTTNGLTCPAWTGWAAYPVTGTYRTLATFQGSELDGQPAIVQSLDGRHTAFLYDALLWKSITSDSEKAKIEESLACQHDLLAVRADFVAAPTSGAAPLTVIYTNTSTGGYTSSLWNLGAGVTSTQQNPTHTYTVSGTYTVGLTINGLMDSDSLTRTNHITVNPVRPYQVYLPLILRNN